MIRSFLRHFRIRLLAVVTDPWLFVGFVLTALASLLYWPGLVDPDRFGFSMEFDRESGGSESDRGIDRAGCEGR